MPPSFNGAALHRNHGQKEKKKREKKGKKKKKGEEKKHTGR